MSADGYFFGVRFLQAIGYFKGNIKPPWKLKPVADAPQPRDLARTLLNKFLVDVDDNSNSADDVKDALKLQLTS
jgi:hypothetical protein